jgi:L-fuconolactonase
MRGSYMRRTCRRDETNIMPPAGLTGNALGDITKQFVRASNIRFESTTASIKLSPVKLSPVRSERRPAGSVPESSKMEVIDGYAHCGLFKYEPLERVVEVMAAAGVGRAVLVQHLGEFDNSYLGEVAAAEPERFAAVCLIDHQPADCVATLRGIARSDRFKGLRLTMEALAARPALADVAVECGLVLLLYMPHSVAPVASLLDSLVERHPASRIVLSHLGRPDPAESPRFSKYDVLRRLAEHPNVYLQLSGMKLVCPWPHEPLYPLIEQAMGWFGPARLYWGSNFPVVGDTTDYLNDLSLLLEGKLPIALADIPAIAGGNAKRLWFPEIG